MKCCRVLGKLHSIFELIYKINQNQYNCLQSIIVIYKFLKQDSSGFVLNVPMPGHAVSQNSK